MTNSKKLQGREIKVEKTVEGVKVIGGTNHHGNGCSNTFASAEFKSTSQMLHFFNLIAGKDSQLNVKFAVNLVECINNDTNVMHFNGGKKTAEQFVKVLEWQVADNAWMTK